MNFSKNEKKIFSLESNFNFSELKNCNLENLQLLKLK
jgi:hypothetical protein